MGIEHYKNAVFVKLEEYIPANMFRTVSRKQLELPYGITEIKVEMEIKATFAREHNFQVSASGRVYGYIRMNDLLQKLNGTREGKNGRIKNITINDWDDKFLMVIEINKGEDIAYYVTLSEVEYLLENCLHYFEK